MHTMFGLRSSQLRAAIQAVAPVCPKASADPQAAPLKPSEWAEKYLHFKATPKQLEVLDLEAKNLILCCNRQWGKTTVIAIKALHHALHNPLREIVIISRTKQQAAILIDRAVNFYLALGHKLRRVRGQMESLKLHNGSTIIAVPHDEDTSCGNTAHILIVDEAALVKDAVFSSVTAFTSHTKGAIWLMSTPRRQAGFFYNLWHCTDKRWRRILSTVKDCPDFDPDFLAMQQSIDPIKYRQDFLCEFIQPADSLISADIINRMVDPTLEPWQVPPSIRY